MRTSSDVRQPPREACNDVWVHVVRVARAAGVMPVGNVSTDGTHRQGKASRHTAMGDGARQKAGERWREAIAVLVTEADQQDAADAAPLRSRRGEALPAELARREDRGPRVWQRCDGWRHQPRVRPIPHVNVAPRWKRSANGRARPAAATRPKRWWRPPDDTAQSPWTDPALHSMRTTKKGWDYCGNAQARGDGRWQRIVAGDVPEASNDKPQAAPVAQATRAPLRQAGLDDPQDEAGAVQPIPATLDHGSESAAAVAALER